MNAKEHNEAVHAQIEKVLPEKLEKALPRTSEDFRAKTQKALMAGYWTDIMQHIVNAHYGYNRAVEETADVIANRMINDLHLAAAES